MTDETTTTVTDETTETAAVPEAPVEDVLVEEVSIDGMCGVY
ncbi:mycofactocin precursor [Jatrophihabitans endophyticus]|uniref:Mycofactocin n=1 Tax=Jatrophihabitans endophyticus TaxID=1206085 RepID=A0A1M5Q1E0_9ACTN|nr:mycofactocin precursor MftA [Jatrophihabitans endophyticus]SHH08097.1 mycofactocin precursor [Jatrophihabitans endophyticus]